MQSRWLAGLALGFCMVMLGTTSVFAFTTEDDMSPSFIEGSIQDTYTVTDTGDGKVMLSTSTEEGYETFVKDGTEFNYLAVTSRGTTEVAANHYTGEGLLDKTYKIVVKIAGDKLSAKATVGGTTYKTKDTVQVNNSEKTVVITVSGFLFPQDAKIEYNSSKCDFRETKREYTANGVVLTGKIQATSSRGTGYLKTTASETVNGKESKITFTISTTTGKASSSSKKNNDDDDDEDEAEISLSTDRMEMATGATDKFFVEISPDMSKAEFDDDDYEIKLESKDVKLEISDFDSTDDPYKACVIAHAPEEATQAYVYVTLEQDGDEIMSKTLKINVVDRGGTTASGGTTSFGRPTSGTTGASGNTNIPSLPRASEGTPADSNNLALSDDKEPTIAGMTPSKTVLGAVDALGAGETLEYDTAVASKIGRLTLEGLRTRTGKGVLYKDKISRCSVLFSAGLVRTLGNEDYYSTQVLTDFKDKEAILRLLNAAGYSHSVDTYGFDLPDDQFEVVLSLYTFIRDGRTAYVYRYDPDTKTLTSAGNQVVKDNHITLQTSVFDPIVILESDASKIMTIGKEEDKAEKKTTEEDRTENAGIGEETLAQQAGANLADPNALPLATDDNLLSDGTLTDTGLAGEVGGPTGEPTVINTSKVKPQQEDFRDSVLFSAIMALATAVLVCGAGFTAIILIRRHRNKEDE